MSIGYRPIYNGDNSSIDISSSQMILPCVKLTEKAHQLTPCTASLFTPSSHKNYLPPKTPFLSPTSPRGQLPCGMTAWSHQYLLDFSSSIFSLSLACHQGDISMPQDSWDIRSLELKFCHLNSFLFHYKQLHYQVVLRLMTQFPDRIKSQTLITFPISPCTHINLIYLYSTESFIKVLIGLKLSHVKMLNEFQIQ